MPDEIITAKTLPKAKQELRNIYKVKSSKFKEITKKEYESYDTDEREDSDNHLNLEKLGKKADVIDLAYYKYLPDRQVAYRIILKSKSGKEMEDYFIVVPDLA